MNVNEMVVPVFHLFIKVATQMGEDVLVTHAQKLCEDFLPQP